MATDARCGGPGGGPPAAQFAQRYGFRGKSIRVRFRVLYPSRALLGTGVEEDITLGAEAFARLDPALSQVFIAENEVNYLAFPPRCGSNDGRSTVGATSTPMVFAIPDQLQARFAQVESFLMDRETLLAHRTHWVEEARPTLSDLPRLSPDERALFDDLRWKRLADGPLRLEQERIGFGWVEAALAPFPVGSPV